MKLPRMLIFCGRNPCQTMPAAAIALAGRSDRPMARRCRPHVRIARRRPGVSRIRAGLLRRWRIAGGGRRRWRRGVKGGVVTTFGENRPSRFRRRAKHVKGRANLPFGEIASPDMSMDIVSISRALISVSDKTGLLDLGRALAARGVEIVSTGGTSSALSGGGVAVVDVGADDPFPGDVERPGEDAAPERPRRPAGNPPGSGHQAHDRQRPRAIDSWS